MIRLLLFVCSFVCLPHVVAAQVTEDFTIRVFGATDIEAPSTTTIQSIDPVTFSQIDLTWATSTDNFMVFGYVLFRDGVAIATTTQASYSDTGLMASTTYSYAVVAFDGVPNYSAASVSVSTTTPDVPVVTVATSSAPGTATAARVALNSIAVDPDVSSADVLVEVRRPARIEIRIGETDSYEIGYITGTRFGREHVIPINNLRSNTTYFYEVYGYTASGAQTFLYRGSFDTLGDSSQTAPVNVSRFTATAQMPNVSLEWELPNSLPAGARVRVVRNHYGYPSFINDGYIVYEGMGESAVDQDVLSSFNPVYYTAFIIDPNGRTSSGAIAQVFIALDAQTVEPISSDLDNSNINNVSPDPGEVTDTSVPASTNNDIVRAGMPNPLSITITQQGKLFTMASDTVSLSGDEVFMISVPANAISGEYKTIVATLTDPRGSQKEFSFLLRLNSERTAYQATIAAMHVTGVSDFIVEIYDYDSLVLARYTTTFIFTSDDTVQSSTLEIWWLWIVAAAWYAMILIPFLVLLWLWFVYRRREAEEVMG